MKKYLIEITETLQKQIEIEATSKEEALRIVKEQYRKEDITLTEQEYVQTDFSILNVELVKESKIDNLRKNYPPGTRIKCLHMNDPYHPIPMGTLGTVEHVDDGGTIHMKWDNGSGLGLIPNEDMFIKVSEQSKKKTKEYQR